MNKTKLTIFLAFFVLITACNNSNSKKEIANLKKENEQYLKNFIELDSNYSQHFTIKNDTISIIYGTNGTIIQIDPNAIETTNGKSCTENINVELIELTKKTDFIFNNIQTLSNGKLLVSGGAYYINMKSNGEQLRIKKGSSINIKIPKFTDDPMELFKGVKDSTGQINWVPLNKKFTRKKNNFEIITEPIKPAPFQQIADLIGTTIEVGKDSIVKKQFQSSKATKEEKHNQKENYDKNYKEYLKQKRKYDSWYKKYSLNIETYDAINLGSLGWINCDRFYNNANTTKDIVINLQDNAFETTKFYLIFKSMNSILMQPLINDNSNTLSFKNIPIGENIQILGLAVKNATPYIYQKEINSGQESLIDDVNFKKTNINDIEKLNLDGNKWIKKIYPNPTTGQCLIEFYNINNYILDIINNTGEILKTDLVNSSPYKMELSNLSSGIYTIRVSLKDNPYFETRRIVKN